MNTLLIGIGLMATVVALVFISAYISVLLDDRRYYKMLAERWEEAYFENCETARDYDTQGATRHMAHWAYLEMDVRDSEELEHDVMNGIDKHLY